MFTIIKTSNLIDRIFYVKKSQKFDWLTVTNS